MEKETPGNRPGDWRIDHSECFSVESFNSSAHTHEGQTGWWLFPSEVPETGRRIEQTDSVRPHEQQTVGFDTHPYRMVAELTYPCPASIYLMGTVANCTEPRGHDEGPNPTNHKITIEWSVR